MHLFVIRPHYILYIGWIYIIFRVSVEIMETNDEVVERQKLVTNDIEGDEDINNHTTVPKSAKSENILATPTVPKMIVKQINRIKIKLNAKFL